MPQAINRKKIGLLGGSFNPPHYGHVYISESAISALNLDEVWWLVSPLNPFKSAKDMLSLEKRIKLAQNISKNNHIKVVDLESEINTKYSVDTLNYIVKTFPDVHFIWLMGDDLLHDFVRWKNWKQIVELVDIVVFTRVLAEKDLTNMESVRYLKQKKKWNYIKITPCKISSTEIRNQEKTLKL